MVQELIGVYIMMEEYFMREMILKVSEMPFKVPVGVCIMMEEYFMLEMILKVGEIVFKVPVGVFIVTEEYFMCEIILEVCASRYVDSYETCMSSPVSTS